MTRRLFIKMTSAAAATLAFSQWAFAKGKKLMLIDITGKKRTDAANKAVLGVAKGINYVPDVAKAVKDGQAKFQAKNGVKPEAQFCNTCLFHQPYGAAEGVKCTMLNGVLVHEKGGCASWAKKPG